MIPSIGAPKATRPQTSEDYRWLSRQWLYTRCIGYTARYQVGVCRRAQTTDEVIAILFELVYYADVWSLPLYIAAEDIQTAHDCVRQEDQIQALCAEHWHPRHVVALIEQYSCMEMTRTIPVVGDITPFSFDLGLLQGDPESSKSFDAIVGSVLDRLAEQWTVRGYGFVLKESCERFLRQACG